MGSRAERIARLREEPVKDSENSLYRTRTGETLSEEQHSWLTDFVASAGNAAVGDFGDEVLRAVGATDLGDKLREAESRLKEKHKFSYFASKILGSLIPGAAITKGLGLAGKAVAGTTKLGQAVRVGAVEGAIQGAGSADGQSASERIDDALIGGAIGGAGTAVVGKVLGKTLGTKVPEEKKIIGAVASRLGIGSNLIEDGLASGKTLQEVLVASKGISPEVADNEVITLLRTDPEVGSRIQKIVSEEVSSRKANSGENIRANYATGNIAGENLNEVGVSISKARNPLEANEQITKLIQSPESAGVRKDLIVHLKKQLSEDSSILALAGAKTDDINVKVFHRSDLDTKAKSGFSEDAQFFIKSVDGEFTPVNFTGEHLNEAYKFLKVSDNPSAKSLASDQIDNLSPEVKAERTKFAEIASMRTLFENVDKIAKQGSQGDLNTFLGKLKKTNASNRKNSEGFALTKEQNDAVFTDVLNAIAQDADASTRFAPYIKTNLIPELVEQGRLSEEVANTFRNTEKYLGYLKISEKNFKTSQGSMLGRILTGGARRLPDTIVFRSLPTALKIVSARAATDEFLPVMSKRLGSPEKATRVVEAMLQIGDEATGEVMTKLAQSSELLSEKAFFDQFSAEVLKRNAAIGGVVNATDTLTTENNQSESFSNFPILLEDGVETTETPKTNSGEPEISSNTPVGFDSLPILDLPDL